MLINLIQKLFSKKAEPAPEATLEPVKRKPGMRGPDKRPRQPRRLKGETKASHKKRLRDWSSTL
jgi:hypothetical protein